MAESLDADSSKRGKPNGSVPEGAKNSDKLCAVPMSQQGSGQSSPGSDDGERGSETQQARKKIVRPARGDQATKASPGGSTGQPVGPTNPVPGRKPPFDQTHKRVTTYLEASAYQRLQQLHTSGQVGRISHLINEAVKSYMDKFYGIR